MVLQCRPKGEALLCGPKVVALHCGYKGVALHCSLKGVAFQCDPKGVTLRCSQKGVALQCGPKGVALHCSHMSVALPAAPRVSTYMRYTKCISVHFKQFSKSDQCKIFTTNWFSIEVWQDIFSITMINKDLPNQLK